jgi:hypothetical protein
LSDHDQRGAFACMSGWARDLSRRGGRTWGGLPHRVGGVADARRPHRVDRCGLDSVGATRVHPRRFATVIYPVAVDGLIHHSDAGSQYTAAEPLLDAGALASIGTGGDSFANALAESVVGLYKTEAGHRRLGVVVQPQPAPRIEPTRPAGRVRERLLRRDARHGGLRCRLRCLRRRSCVGARSGQDRSSSPAKNAGCGRSILTTLRAGGVGSDGGTAAK